ncbi:hypothetical protein H6G73_17825 [Richelia sinica FACHB-800]|nr:hypothetical protein [Richelia sinica FACHB-800]
MILDLHLVTRPISQFEFFLETDSLVDVLVNGRLERTLQLRAGRQDIRNLPLNGGTNDVELVIKDDVGRVQRLNFSNPVDGDLLAPGVQQFAYSLGVPSADISGNRTYDFTQPILTLSHRLCITNQFTLGSYLQADLHQQLAGLERIFATNYGNFVWSRSLNNSFALLIPKDSVRGQEIGINPSSGGYTTRIDNLGFGVVPNLSPYNISTVIIDAPNLPVGMDLGNRAIKILPTYSSGTVVRVGTDATVFLRGVLLNSDGEPISLQSAQIVAVGDRNWQPVTIFTNRAGKFATSGLKPGRYEIRLFTNPPALIPFAIPSDAKGIYNIGTLKIPSK